MIKNIRNMDKYIELCTYDIENKEYRIVSNVDGNLTVDVGFFFRDKDDVFGVIASPRGPILFHNNLLYYLQEIDYTFSHRHIERKIGEFKLMIGNDIKEDIVYNITPYTNYDVWSKEEDVDFFQWLYHSTENEVAKESFHKYYTRL